MISGLLAGELLRSPRSSRAKFCGWSARASLGVAAGVALDLSRRLPDRQTHLDAELDAVQRRPVFADPGGFLCRRRRLGFREWTFPLVVVGMNSITMYCMAELIKPWMYATLQDALRHVDFRVRRRAVSAANGQCVGAAVHVAGMLLAVPAEDLHSDLSAMRSTSDDSTETLRPPRLRRVESFPVSQPNGETLFALRDPEGFSGSVVLPYHAAVLASLMDGSRTLDDIQAEFHRRFGQQVPLAEVEKMVRELDARYVSRQRAVPCPLEGRDRRLLESQGAPGGACRRRVCGPARAPARANHGIVCRREGARPTGRSFGEVAGQRRGCLG